MAQQEIYYHTYPNGMTLVAEHMDHVRSAAFSFLVPSGYIYDPPDKLGMSNALCELMTRGAGERDSRALTLALDNLGLDRSESVGTYNLSFGAGTLSRNLAPALEIYADILRRPHLSPDEMEPVRALILQELYAMEDNHPRKAFVELRRLYFPSPFGRHRGGTPEGVANIDIDAVRSYWSRMFGPRDAILSVAGNIHWPQLRDHVGELFGDWRPQAPPQYVVEGRGQKRGHLHKDTTQTHITLAYRSVPFGHEDYYIARGAVSVLSGGMSSRLFTEVREKRGLCYSVGAQFATLKDRGAVFCYAGTTNDRAQETLDVTIQELQRLQDGVEKEELQRVRAGLKSSLIMEGESTSARASALAVDWFYLGRVRSLDEIEQAINSMTPERVVEHVHKFPAKDFTIVTLGPEPLQYD